MKKLFKSFGFAVVIAVISLNALLITGCPDAGIVDTKNKDTSNPSSSLPLDGKGKTIVLKANRWGTESKGENWSSGDQIKYADIAGIKLKKGNTYSFKLTGKSSEVLERVQLQLFSGNRFETWLGSSTTDLVKLEKNFEKVISIEIKNDPDPTLPVILQLNNIMWQTNQKGEQLFPDPTPIPSEIEQDTVMATITDLLISLYNIEFAEPPEESSPEERWSSFVDSGSTATLDSYFSEGVMTAIVGGTAMPNVQDNWNAWRVQVGFYYTAKANAQYTFKFQAWTASGTRDLHLQYYENASTNTYLSSNVSITTTPTTYEVLSDIIPTDGIESARFLLADQLGTVYIKIIEIKKYEFTGGTLTVSNISGTHGLEIGSNIQGETGGDPSGINLIFGSAVEINTWDNGLHMSPKAIKITGNTVNIHVWQVNQNTNTFAPFTGNTTIPIGHLQLKQINFKSANNSWSSDDYYLNKVPIIFTGGSASIDFGNQMEYEGSYFPGVNGGEGHFVSPYQITVTGVSGKTGHVNITVYSDINTPNGEVFWGDGDISGNSVIINLRKNNEAAQPFTGSGRYYLIIRFDNNENSEEYYYTDGQGFASLNITQDSDFYEHYNRLPKCNITSMPFTIDLSKFRKRPEPQEWYPSNRITTITITNTGITDYRGGGFTLNGPNYNSSLNTKLSNGNITSYFLDVVNNSYSLRFDLYGDNDSNNYVYTEGQTFAQLGIASESDLDSKLPRYNITSGATTSINFSQFKKLPKPYEWYSSYKTITITGINGDYWGSFSLVGSNHYYTPIYDTNSWNGNSRNITTYWVDFEHYPGSYYLVFNISRYIGSSFVQEQYVYTNGSTLASLGISSTNDFVKLPEFTVTTMPNTTIIDFSKFQKVPSGW